MQVALKRVYRPPSPTDGTRIRLDRLWPRGLSKKKARVDLWLKEIAPTDRTAPLVRSRSGEMGGVPAPYRAELDANADAVSGQKAALSTVRDAGPGAKDRSAQRRRHAGGLSVRDEKPRFPNVIPGLSRDP